MKIIGKTWLTILACLAPAIVLAQGLKDAGTKLGVLQTQGVALSSDVGGMTNTIVTLVLSLVGTIFFVLMIYGGFVWMKASGREEEISRAKRIVITSSIGIAVILASYGITNFVLLRLASQPGGAGGSGDGTTCIEWGGTCVDGVDTCLHHTGPEGGITAAYTCPSSDKPVCCLPN